MAWTCAEEDLLIYWTNNVKDGKEEDLRECSEMYWKRTCKQVGVTEKDARHRLKWRQLICCGEQREQPKVEEDFYSWNCFKTQLIKYYMIPIHFTIRCKKMKVPNIIIYNSIVGGLWFFGTLYSLTIIACFVAFMILYNWSSSYLLLLTFFFKNPT